MCYCKFVVVLISYYVFIIRLLVFFYCIRVYCQLIFQATRFSKNIKWLKKNCKIDRNYMRQAIQPVQRTAMQSLSPQGQTAILGQGRGGGFNWT